MNAFTRFMKGIWETFIPSDPEPPSAEEMDRIHERTMIAEDDWRAWQAAFDWLNVNEPEPGDGSPRKNYMKAWHMVENSKRRRMET